MSPSWDLQKHSSSAERPAGLAMVSLPMVVVSVVFFAMLMLRSFQSVGRFRF
jgi:hypothetical protein